MSRPGIVFKESTFLKWGSGQSLFFLDIFSVQNHSIIFKHWERSWEARLGFHQEPGELHFAVTDVLNQITIKPASVMTLWSLINSFHLAENTVCGFIIMDVWGDTEKVVRSPLPFLEIQKCYLLHLVWMSGLCSTSFAYSNQDLQLLVDQFYSQHKAFYQNRTGIFNWYIQYFSTWVLFLWSIFVKTEKPYYRVLEIYREVPVLKTD